MKKNDGEGNNNNARDHLSSGEIRLIGKSGRLVSVIWEQDWLFRLELKGYPEQILLDLLLAKRLLVNLMLNLQLLIDLLWQQYRAEQLWCRCCCWKNPGPRSYEALVDLLLGDLLLLNLLVNFRLVAGLAATALVADFLLQINVGTDPYLIKNRPLVLVST